MTAPISAASEPDADGWRCYPSLLSNGTPLTLEIPDAWRGEDAKFSVFDAAGRLVWQSYMGLHAPRMVLEMPSDNWAAGVYRFIMTSERGVKRASLVK